MKYLKSTTILLIFFVGGALFQLHAQNAPPTANCMGNKVVTPIYEGESRDIHARQFDQNSYDDNTPQDQLRFSYSNDPADSLMVIDCNSESDLELTIFVFDEEGAYDSCFATLNIDKQCDATPIIKGTEDTIAPTIFLVDEIALLTLDSVSFSELSARDFDAGTVDNISERSKLKFSFSEDTEDDKRYYHCDDYPGFDFTIYVTDEAGNQSFCRTSIFIDTTNCNDAFIIDTVPPVATCIGEYVVDLDENGEASILAADLDDGSYDGDHVTPDSRLAFGFDLNDRSSSTLNIDCDDLGDSNRTIYVWDYAGNVDSCSFTLSVNDPLESCVVETVDTIPPTASCVSLIEIELQGDTVYVLEAQVLDKGSEDDETAAEDLKFSFSIDTLDTIRELSCMDLGNNEIELFVTDEAGNYSTCTSVVSLSDPDDLCVDDTTSVYDLHLVDWNIYPNPFTDIFTVENLPTENGPVHLSIYDVNGKKVYEQEFTDSDIQIRAELMNGNYFIQLTQMGKVLGLHKIQKN